MNLSFWLFLRETKDTKEVLEVCEAIGPKGSLFSIPVLMAKITTTKDSIQQSYYIATLAIIRSRMQDWDRGPENDFFNPEWWKIKWVGGNERFISFISMLAGADEDGFFGDEKMEQMANLFIPEMNVDLSPYKSFKELKLMTPDWNPKEDLILVKNAVAEELLMHPIFEDTLIAKHEDTQVKDNIIDMRMDYLITKLGLYHDFDHYHYMLLVALVLNQQ